MRFLTISTALILSLNASSLTDSLIDGKISGKVGLWYQSSDDKKPYWQEKATGKNIFSKENSIANAGLEIGYKSKDYKGFSVGAKFYLLDALNLHQSIVSSTPHGDLGVNSTATWLGEGYFRYRYEDSAFKVGRQNINSPLLNSDTWAIHPNNFEGATFIDKTLPNTTLLGAYIVKERVNDKEEFEDFMKFVNVDSDYALMFGASHQLDDLTLTGFYYNVENILDSIYADANYKYKNLELSSQFIAMLPKDKLSTKFNNNDDETIAYGLKASFTYSIFKFSLAYTQTSEDGFIPIANLADNMIKTPLYTATISGDSDIAGLTDTTGYKASLRAKVTNELSTILNWGFYEHGDSSKYFADNSGAGDESLTAEFILKYRYDKHLKLFLAYMFTDEAKGEYYNDSENVNSVRLWVKYRF